MEGSFFAVAITSILSRTSGKRIYVKSSGSSQLLGLFTSLFILGIALYVFEDLARIAGSIYLPWFLFRISGDNIQALP